MKKMLLVCLVIAALPTVALAQSGTGPVATAWGPRVGFSSGPDQFVVGAHLDLGALAPDLTFMPNVELGFGDNLTTFAMNGDFHYHFRIQNSLWRPYAGGGLGITHFSWDTPAGDFSDTDVGAAAIIGAIVPTQTGSRFFVEAKVGLGDIADFKALVGWSFGL